MNVYVSAIAASLPESAFSTAELLTVFGHKLSPDLIKTINTLGIDKRYSVLSNYPEFLLGKKMDPTTSATNLGARAVRQCLEQANTNPAEVGLLIAASNTQSRLLPGLASDVMASLNGLLQPSISLINMQGQGCSALLKAVEVAKWYLGANPTKKVLVLVSEAHTPYGHQIMDEQYNTFREVKKIGGSQSEQSAKIQSTQEVIQNMLFGDGAVALLLGANESKLAFGPICHLTNEKPEDVNLLVMEKGGSEDPFVDGRPKYVMKPGVPKLGAAYAANSVKAVLEHPESSISCVDQATICLIHTGSGKILNEVSAQLGLPANSPKVSASYAVLRDYGNLSSASVGFMLLDNNINKGTGIMVSFGVGFSASTGVFTFQ